MLSDDRCKEFLTESVIRYTVAYGTATVNTRYNEYGMAGVEPIGQIQIPRRLPSRM